MLIQGEKRRSCTKHEQEITLTPLAAHIGQHDEHYPRPVGTFRGPGPSPEAFARAREKEKEAGQFGLLVGLVLGALCGLTCATGQRQRYWVLGNALAGLAGGLALDRIGAAGLWWGIELVLVGALVGAALGAGWRWATRYFAAAG
jgi:hypothetical protein